MPAGWSWFGEFINNFAFNQHIRLVSLLLTLNKYLPAKTQVEYYHFAEKWYPLVNVENSLTNSFTDFH